MADSWVVSRAFLWVVLWVASLVDSWEHLM
jgi:hypothetical protein